MARGCFPGGGGGGTLAPHPSADRPMHAPASATIYDAEEYRRRKALRDCGRHSRRREFLWVQPGGGAAVLAVFRPARPEAADALRDARSAGRAG